MHCENTLLIPAPGLKATPLLWVILTRPDQLCIIVCLSTLRYDKEQTVVLRRGDHGFVGHDTAVLYSYAEIVDVNHLLQQVADGLALRHESCRPDILKLIQDGIPASPFTPRKIANF